MLNIPEYENAQKVFFFFNEISKIPRTSGNSVKIADFLESFAKERGLFCVRDNTDNVIIRKNATSGYEKKPAIIFQAHTDMVADKLPECEKDLLHDGIEIYREGDFLHARGTTLGADNGIGVAYALAVLDSDNIPHPEFEAVFTSDEETGLTGANNLDTSVLHGKRMINVDSDIEGVFTVGCAGGIRLDATLTCKTEESRGSLYKISVLGLRGGHSGMEIDKGHENAIKILGEILEKIKDFRIAGIFGGNADNAIPRSAECIIEADCKDYIANEVIPACLDKYKSTESDIAINFSAYSEALPCFSKRDSQKIVELIDKFQTVFKKFSCDVARLFETSSNLGIIETTGERVTLTLSVRSSKESEKQIMVDSVSRLAESFSATLSAHSEYPAWEYVQNSPLTESLSKIYRESYKKEPTAEIIHAGLECGIFANKIKCLDCVSLGPCMFDIHTTDERLSISSTARVWEFLKTALKEI